MSSVRVNSWIFPTLICVGLSGIYMVEWRSGRSEKKANMNAFVEALKGIDTKFGLERAETQSLIGKTRELLDALVAKQDAIITILQEGTSDALATVEIREIGEEATEYEDPIILTDDEDLVFPQVPDGMNPIYAVESLEFGDLVESADLNPNNGELSQLGYRRAANLITHAKARLSTVTSDLHLMVSEEKEKLLEQGIYVDYAKGQRIDQMEDVATLGEMRADGGMRIFPFFSEDYPKIYALREA